LLRCGLERQHCIWRILKILDLLGAGDEDIAVGRSEKLKWLAIRLIEEAW
jgi:hypothetical protein